MENNKKLTRASAGNRMVAGVCAGIADYFGWDPTLLRIVYVLATIFTAFAGIIIYIILWIVMPERRPGDGEHCKSAGVCHFYSCLAEKGSGNFLPETNTVPIRILLSTASMPDSFETSSGTSPHDLLHEPFLSVHLPVPSSPLYYSSTGHGDNPATQESMP